MTPAPAPDAAKPPANAPQPPVVWADISDSIAKGCAVAFVGAGVSATTGAKTWEQLLRAQLAAAMENATDTADLRKAASVLKNGELTLAASLLKRIRGHRFGVDLAREFSAYKEPGFAHRAIVRLPFAHLITTNYDPLLELAFLPAVTDPIAYTQPESMLERIRKDEPTLFKLHGQTAHPFDAVITEDDFRSIQRSKPLSQCLRILFLTKHIVFIGHSLRDPDLLSLLSDLKQQFPNAGPHYAILGDNEAAPSNSSAAFLHYLENSLNVRAVLYSYKSGERTSALVRTLTLLHGEVCKRRIDRLPPATGPDDGIERQLENLLSHASKLTGALRSDLAFFNDARYSGWALTLNRLQKRLDRLSGPRREAGTTLEPGLYVDYSCGPTSRTYTGEPTIGSAARRHANPDQSYPWSVMWTAFHGSRGPIVLNDANDELEKVGKRIEAYRESDTRVISELAVPVYVGDTRVGILNLESDIPSAFTDAHTRVAEQLSHNIGATWDRLIRSEIYRDVTLDPNKMRPTEPVGGDSDDTSLTRALEKFVPAQLRIASFVADHGKGLLLWRPNEEARRGAPEPPLMNYRFTDPSFAAMVFRRRRPLYVPNLGSRGEEYSWVQFASENAARHQVGEEIVGVPLFSRGLRVGVLTAWPDAAARHAPMGPSASELVIRTAQLFARTHYLRQITQFHDQHQITLQSCTKFQGLVSGPAPETRYEAILACIRQMVGVCGVRLFRAETPIELTDHGPTGELRARAASAIFVCKGSIRGGKHQIHDRNSSITRSYTVVETHLGLKNSRQNPFVEFCVQRASWSASAVLMYPKLLDSRSKPRAYGQTHASAQGPTGIAAIHTDQAATKFGRDHRVGWYVAPITLCTEFKPAANETDWCTEKRLMLGFISADNTVKPSHADPGVNELPASRTWHELARLKLSWCAAMMGYYFSDSGTARKK